MRKRLILPLMIGLSAVLTACPTSKAPSAKQLQAQRAEEAANSITFTSNAEIDNIKRRLELTADPGKIGFIVLFNETGSPIAYYGVKGKITSGGKRLTRSTQFESVGGSLWEREAPSDEGTYGSSNPYVYFWTTEDQYIQWSGNYLYSDQPIRLSQKPLVITVAPNE